MKRQKEEKIRTIKSEKTYWDWVGGGDLEEGRKELPQANPDMLPEPVPGEDGDRMLRLRAIREAELTPHEVLIISLLVDMTQEAVAKHLAVTRSAVADALGRARFKIERKLAILRARELLADKELPGGKDE